MCCNTLAWDLFLLRDNCRKETKPASLFPFSSCSRAARTCSLWPNGMVLNLSLSNRLLCAPFQSLGFAVLLDLRSFRVGDVFELLNSARILLRREHQVALGIEGDSDQGRELSQQIPVSADECQQLAVTAENLQQIEHGVRHPDVPITVDGDALSVCEAPRSITVFAEL